MYHGVIYIYAINNKKNVYWTRIQTEFLPKFWYFKETIIINNQKEVFKHLNLFIHL